MEKFALFFMRLFKLPVQWFGVDYPQFEMLLRTKLIMDFRGTPAGMQSMGSKKRTLTNQLLMYTIFGLFFGVASFSIGDLALSFTIFFSVVMVSLTMTLISEFTSVLFDQRDNYILLPRPVNNRTLLMVRLVHIQFYMGLIALSLSFLTGILVAFKINLIVAVVFFIAVGLSTWIALIFTTFIYLMISKIVNGERFKDIISYAQIIMAVIIFGSYQLLPRLMDIAILKHASLQFKWWMCFFPPAWLASLIKVSYFANNSLSFILLALLGVLLPISGAFLLIKSLSRGFGNILSEGSSDQSEPQKKKAVLKRSSIGLNNIFCVSEFEKAGWDLTMATTKRDRKFKQSVYPFFGLMIVFAVVFLKPDFSNLIASLQARDDFSKYSFIVILGYSVIIAIAQLPYTDTPEASWIYKALPLRDYGDLMTGAIKALLVRFLIPVYLFVTIPSVLLWGISIVPQILLSCLANILLVLSMNAMQKLQLPFTRIREMQQKGTNSLKAIFNMILLIGIAGLVYATKGMPALLTILICVIVSVGIMLLFRYNRKKKIEFSNL